MKTLYDLLGIEHNATHVEIERGYRRSLDAYLAKKGAGQPDQDMLRMQAIREAYLLLCSPTRRQAYDQKLKENRQVTTGRSGMPWAALALALLLAIGGGYYKMQQNNARAAVARAQAKGEHKRSELVTAVEAAKPESTAPRAPSAPASSPREVELPRSDGRAPQTNNQQVLARVN